MSAFQPCSSSDLAGVYGEASTESVSYLDQGAELLDKYSSTIKGLLFDEDPRIVYEKKLAELNTAVASYKKSGAGLVKNTLAAKIRSLQAELPGIKAQIGELETAEATKQASKVAGITLLVVASVTVLLVGNFFLAKASTERARGRQIRAGRNVA